MELTHFFPKNWRFTNKGLWDKVLQCTNSCLRYGRILFFLFQIERPSFLLNLTSEALTRSSCHYYCDQPGYLPFMYKLLFKYTVTLTTFRTHSLTHPRGQCTSVGSPMAKGCKALTKTFFHPREEEETKFFLKNSAHRTGWLNLISAQRVNAERLRLTWGKYFYFLLGIST